MKTLFSLAAAVCTSVLSAADRTSFDFGWKFRPGQCPGAESFSFDDSSWRAVDLPHDFQIEAPWSEKASSGRGFKAPGEGWYRKAFVADSSWKGRRVTLDFEGLLVWGDVFLNGEKVGGTDFGYLGCEVDLTDKLRYGETNVVAVLATTGPDTASRWYTGAGPVRDVWLVIGQKRGFARHGVFVSTPVATARRAEIAVSAALRGFYGETNEVTVAAVVRDPDGREVGRAAGRLTECNLTHPDVKLSPLAIDAPRLWDLDSPVLYSAEVTVSLKGAPIESETVRFGIRELAFGPDFGFRLNGKKVFLAGMANHHDLGALGAAAFPAAVRRYVRTLKAWGYNAIRTSHNPYSVSLLEACDEIGLLVIDEWSDKWNNWTGDNMASRRPFADILFTAIPDWVRRDRNHPSVILWSLGNELQCWDWTNGFPTDDWGVTTYRMLDVLVKRYDPTRKTTVAQYPAARNVMRWDDPANINDPEPSPLLCATDVASQNYMPDRYAGFRRKRPELVLFQSEASTSGLLGPAVAMDHETTVGLAWWGAVEYWGESDRWPKKGWNYSFFAHDLEPYPQAWLITSWLKPGTPVAKIGVEVGDEVKEIWNDMTVGQKQVRATWNFRPGTKSVPRVFVYTNAGEAELFANGVSLGVRKAGRAKDASYGVAEWTNVPYGKGGRLEAVARTDGKEVARDALETTDAATGLEIAVEGEASLRADGGDLLFVRAYAVDGKGRRVPDASDTVKVTVSGAAALQALDDCDHYTDLLPSDNPKRLHHGRLLAILRAGRTPGDAKVVFDSKTLGRRELTVRVRP